VQYSSLQLPYRNVDSLTKLPHPRPHARAFSHIPNWPLYLYPLQIQNSELTAQRKIFSLSCFTEWGSVHVDYSQIMNKYSRRSTAQMKSESPIFNYAYGHPAKNSCHRAANSNSHIFTRISPIYSRLLNPVLTLYRNSGRLTSHGMA
jgi:hypothetical protein